MMLKSSKDSGGGNFPHVVGPVQPENGGNSTGGNSTDMALIGNTDNPLRTASLPKRKYFFGCGNGENSGDDQNY